MMPDIPAVPASEAWPALPLDAWQDTYATLHRWTQIAGKIRLACAPHVNHWWQVPLYVTCRGLTTASVPYGTQTFCIDFDFLRHEVRVETSEGRTRSVPLVPRSVADFYRDIMAALASVGIAVSVWPVPVELDDTLPFTEDHAHASYDAAYAGRFWCILVQVDRVFHAFRADFLGKASPVHFFWGAFDLCVTRFSGRPAPPHPGGIPNVADYVMREAYSHEVSSCGFWPGGGALNEPAFYAYAYPEPEGFRDFPVEPGAASYHEALREFILPYDAVRTAADPDAVLLRFLQSTYVAAAELGGWDRTSLERSPASASG